MEGEISNERPVFIRTFSPNLTLAGITWRRLKIHIGGRVREANFDRVSQRDRVKVSYNFRWMQLKIAYLSLCLSVEIRPIEFYFKPFFVSLVITRTPPSLKWFWIRLNERYFPGNLRICMASHAFSFLHQSSIETTKKIVEQLSCSQDWLKSFVQQVWTLKEKRAKCCSNDCSYCKNALALNINRLFIAGDYFFLFQWRGILAVFLHFHSCQLEPNESIGVAIHLKQTPVHTSLKRSCFEMI